MIKKKPQKKPNKALVAAERFKATRARVQAHVNAAKTEDDDLDSSVFETSLSDVLSQTYANPDARDRALYEVVQQGILSLLPVAERHYRNVQTDRAMTPLDKLLLQLRDVLNEAKKLRELETQHVKIVGMVENSFRSLLEAFVDEAHMFKTTLKSEIGREDYKKVDAALARLIDSQRAMVRELMLTLGREIEGYFKTPVASARTPKRK